jgi:signal transduction histidine kinase
VVHLLSATARCDSNGSIAGVISICQVITERKSLVERMMHFMAVISHELRSPIHGFRKLSDTLALSEKDSQRQRKVNMITHTPPASSASFSTS